MSVSQTVAVGQVLGTTPGIQYDARKYSWIGRINSNVEVQHTWRSSGIRSIEDAKRREVVLAGTGPTSSSVVMPRLMNELIGTRFKVVTGFAGPTSAQLALERGEVEGIVKPWSSIKVGSADWLRDGKINLIVQYTRERHRELPQVPAIVDLGQDPAEAPHGGILRCAQFRQLLNTHQCVLVNRVLMVEVPDDARRDVLQRRKDAYEQAAIVHFRQPGVQAGARLEEANERGPVRARRQEILDCEPPRVLSNAGKRIV